ncbi:Biodegradative arginine decarboxylase [Serratia quinivorans]|uniref:arginine decarboxylase n=1 Tax=Serratia quinivorans TaxID=137545 RepID=UPI00217C7707|nr:arginine decarboxylase [Serratia quinivorans]CAI1913460.1 Biodegradative arginine decarboxylase [Serratia quinivorans]CAI1967252.1 Biodegradative arginine decarboxylase [Serratia quinivorans]CAI2001449.1 Biodegradative arginine decarboxylase [Serratia quinivorans]
MKALLVESDFKTPGGYPTAAIERLIKQLNDRDIEVMRATSVPDGESIIDANEPIDCLLLARSMDPKEVDPAQNLLDKLHERQENAPVFLLSDRGTVTKTLSLEMMEQISEFAWILEDSADFIAGRIMAAIRRYRQQLLPPLMSAIMKYNQTHEYSWAVPGHQGGVGFTKTPAGRIFHDFYGENLFRTDSGIERTALGSLLDHTGAFKDSETNIARVFGAEKSYSGVVGTSGNNRSVMQACLTEKLAAVVDRNCHKSIEQGLILTGAAPVYMNPIRNAYGIIGPVPNSEMWYNTIEYKLLHNPFGERDNGYLVLTNSTYDGICYNVAAIERAISPGAGRESIVPVLHFDEAWYGYARFNTMYKNYFAMRDNPKDHASNLSTVVATQSSHKMLNALSPASYIHIRNGEKPLDFPRFNQAYMMHTTTSPSYIIAASNDIAAQMMDGECGQSLTQEAINEAVDFRQALARLYAEFQKKGEWFFKPWNIEKGRKPGEEKDVPFQDIPAEALATDQSYWVMNPDDEWHGFKGLDADWAMIDPVKVSILAPGINVDGTLEDTGVPAALVNAWLARNGIVPTRTTDFQLMFLFSMGVTKGKWGTLLEALLSFKRHYDANTPLCEVLPELAAKYSAEYGALGLKDLGDKMFAFLKQDDLGKLLNQAYDALPTPVLTPRAAYQKMVQGECELVGLDDLHGRVAANAVLPYPPGIPMLMSGEQFGEPVDGKESAQIAYLRALQKWDDTFAGFEHETAGITITDGKYQVMCIKTI